MQKKKNHNLKPWILNIGYLIAVQKKKKKSLFILQDLNNLQISELKNVEEEKLSSENITFHLLIKTMTKFFNMTGYLQPSLRTNSTV